MEKMQAQEMMSGLRIPEMDELGQFFRSLPTSTLVGIGALTAVLAYWLATRPRPIKPPCSLLHQSEEVPVRWSTPTHNYIHRVRIINAAMIQQTSNRNKHTLICRHTQVDNAPHFFKVLFLPPHTFLPQTMLPCQMREVRVAKKCWHTHLGHLQLLSCSHSNKLHKQGAVLLCFFPLGFTCQATMHCPSHLNGGAWQQPERKTCRHYCDHLCIFSRKKHISFLYFDLYCDSCWASSVNTYIHYLVLFFCFFLPLIYNLNSLMIICSCFYIFFPLKHHKYLHWS